MSPRRSRIKVPRMVIWMVVALTVSVFVLSACSSRMAKRGSGYEQEGMASYYAHKFDGRTTANGEIYDERKMTAAHRD